MWVIAGLGNPGRRYARTRHNIGFMVVDNVAARYGIELKKREAYSIARGSMEGEDVILVEPLTFMNRSGLAVRDIAGRYNFEVENLIVIHDDIDMETGKVRLRRRGSSGGHKGVESIIREIGSRDFIRVKIGVGREEGVPVEDYVLSRFRKDEAAAVNDAIVKATEAIVMIIGEGIEEAMNAFN